MNKQNNELTNLLTTITLKGFSLKIWPSLNRGFEIFVSKGDEQIYAGNQGSASACARAALTYLNCNYQPKHTIHSLKCIHGESRINYALSNLEHKGITGDPALEIIDYCFTNNVSIQAILETRLQLANLRNNDMNQKFNKCASRINTAIREIVEGNDKIGGEPDENYRDYLEGLRVSRTIAQGCNYYFFSSKRTHKKILKFHKSTEAKKTLSPVVLDGIRAGAYYASIA